MGDTAVVWMGDGDSQCKVTRLAWDITQNDYQTASMSEPDTTSDPKVRSNRHPLDIRDPQHPEGHQWARTRTAVRNTAEIEQLTLKNARIATSINNYKLRLKKSEKTILYQTISLKFFYGTMVHTKMENKMLKTDISKLCKVNIKLLIGPRTLEIGK